MKTKLSPTQATVLQIIACAAGRHCSFDGAQLRAAAALLSRELIERKGRGFGFFYTLTKAGEDYAREAGWLTTPEAKQPEALEAAAVVAAPRGEASDTDVIKHLLDSKKRQTLKAAEQLLAEVTSFVERMRTGQIPTTCININSVGFLVADHAKLLTLTEVLEGIAGTEQG